MPSDPRTKFRFSGTAVIKLVPFRGQLWNALELSVTSKDTTALVKHWTGRQVCIASTKEWAIQKFLYSHTDRAALKIVGQVIGQRCLETGITEVALLVDKKDQEKDKIKTFTEAIRQTGLVLKEAEQFEPNNRFGGIASGRYQARIKPWEIVDE